MASAGLKTIILLSFVLALSFLLIILSGALYSNWTTLLVATIFAFAPLPNFLASSCGASSDDFSGEYSSAPQDFGHFLTSIFLVSGFALPFVLAHSGVIAEPAAWMSAIGGAVGYGTMPITTKALVLDGEGKPFVLRDVIVDDPSPNELLIKITACGICHSDLSVQNGHIKLHPSSWPVVLGHEGAGVIAEVGSEVTGFEVGDHVLLSFNYCGTCEFCEDGMTASCVSWLPLNFGFTRSNGSKSMATQVESGAPVGGMFFGQSAMAGYTLASPKSCIKVGKDVDLKLSSQLGCGTLTGSGTVYQVLRPTPSTSVGVIGLGSVGLSALCAAKNLGVTTLIAIDLVQSRLDMALELGASHVINGKDTDIVEQIAKITGGKMLKQVVEASGVDAGIKLAFNCLGPRGIQAQVGVFGSGKPLSIETASFQVQQKTIIGVLEGDSNPAEAVPKLVKLSQEGAFPLEKISKLFPIADFQKAIDSMLDGSVIKPILVFD